MIQKGPLKSILSSHYSSPANRPLWRVPLNNAHSWFAGCVLVLGDEAHRENTTEGKHDRGLLMGRTGRGVCLVYSWQRPCRCHLLSPRRGNWSGLMGKYAQGEDGSPEKFEQSAVIDLWQLSGERKDEGDEESFSTEVQWSSYRKRKQKCWVDIRWKCGGVAPTTAGIAYLNLDSWGHKEKVQRLQDAKC